MKRKEKRWDPNKQGYANQVLYNRRGLSGAGQKGLGMLIKSGIDGRRYLSSDDIVYSGRVRRTARKVQLDAFLPASETNCGETMSAWPRLSAIKITCLVDGCRPDKPPTNFEQFR